MDPRASRRQGGLRDDKEGFERTRRASKGQGGLRKDVDNNEGFDDEGETQKDQERLRRRG